MPPLPPLPGAPGPARGSRGGSRGSQGRPQRYRRHPKPPYSYLALIALVIRAAPGRRLKLAQIIQQLRSLFPFFGGGYQGWKDSVRHNLSSNPCFAKVLKDPTKPQAKGNYWTVDVTRIPPAALKLQNTAVARGGGGGATPFVPDLSPFVLLGCPYPPSPTPSHSSFSIASLLRENPGIGDTKELGSSSPPTLLNPTWVPQKGSDPPQPRGTSPPILWRSQKGSDHSPPHGTSPPILWGSQKGSDPSSPQGTLPPILWGSQKGSDPAPLWGQLPTSYSTAVAPNAVAPPPHGGGTPFLALHWGVLPHPPPPRPPPHPEGDLGSPPPPNKSVFDVWLSHPGDIALRG